MANYTTIDDPTAFFQCKLYTGTGNSHAITLDGLADMQPDMVWWKERTSTDYHTIVDSVRGVTKRIFTNDTGAEDTNAESLKSFQSNGFTMGTNTGANHANQTYVAWNWKAGTSFTNDASSTSVGTIDSAGSVNTDAGFSIQTWTGTGSGGTIAHGLGAVPGFMIVKNRSDGGRNWPVYFGDRTKYMYLSSTDAQANAGTIIWNNTTPTSTVFSVGNDNGVNESSKNYVGYVFAEKKGYSKFGSYIGSGATPGSFSNLGFKPAFLLVKEKDGADGWGLYDNKRNPSNTTSFLLQAQSTAADSNAAANSIDFLSNGFRVCASGSQGNFINESGKTYIYAAFAEQPFVTSTGVPATAR